MYILNLYVLIYNAFLIRSVILLSYLVTIIYIVVSFQIYIF